MKLKSVLFSVLALFALGINSVYALEAEEGWTKYDSGTAAIEVNKLLEFEEKLSTRVNEINKLNLDRVYRYRIESNYDSELDDYMEVSNDMAFESAEEALEWASSNVSENEGWLFVENIVSSFEFIKTLPLTRCETEEVANKVVSDFESTIDEGTGSIFVNEIRDKDGDTTEKVENNYKFDTFEEATSAAERLRENNHDYVVTVSVVSGDPEYVKTETLTLDSIFDSIEKVREYIAGLEAEGYTVTAETTEVNEYEALEDVYETVEEANAALAKFLESYPETTVYNIEEVRDKDGDTTEKVENTYKFDTREEAEETAETLREEEKYYVVEVSVVEEDPEYVETITDTLRVSFNTREEAETYVEDLKSQGYNVNVIIEEVNDLSTLDNVYETREEAEEVLTEFLKNYPETTVYNIEEVRDEDGDTTEKVENNYKFDTFEGATSAAEELRANNHDYITEVNVYAGVPELVETKTLTLNRVFDSREEALNYIADLEAEGYTVTANIEEVTETISLNQSYDTLIEANEALEAFRSQCQELTSSSIEETRDNEEDTTTTTTGSIEYDTRENAEEAAENLTTSGDGYEVVANVREESKSVTVGPTEVESEQFDSQAEAQAYIDNLAAQGYDVSDLEIELVPFEESIWGEEDDVVVNPGTGSDTSFRYGHFDVTLLTEFTKIDANGNETTVTGVVTINAVEINNRNITMEGPSKDQNTGLTEYTSKERHNLNVTNNSLVEVSGTVAYYTDADKTILSTPIPFTIDGYLTESQNVCGGGRGEKGFDLKFESITIINNRVVVDSNIINKYKVTGTITKSEQIPVYYVDTTTITYGYDYNVNAEGIKLVGYSVNGDALKNIYKDVYLLDINKTILDYDYKVTADGIKFIEYLVKGTASKDIYKDVYTLNINRTTLDYDYKVTADGIKFIGYSVEGYASKDIYKDVYLLDINKTTLDYDYEVSGTGIKTYYDVISKFVRLVDVNWIIEYITLGKGGDVEVLPPQTGININYLFINIIGSLFIGLYLLVRRFI